LGIRRSRRYLFDDPLRAGLQQVAKPIGPPAVETGVGQFRCRHRSFRSGFETVQKKTEHAAVAGSNNTGQLTRDAISLSSSSQLASHGALEIDHADWHCCPVHGVSQFQAVANSPLSALRAPLQSEGRCSRVRSGACESRRPRPQPPRCPKRTATAGLPSTLLLGRRAPALTSVAVDGA
jgi:hypothetical protein